MLLANGLGVRLGGAQVLRNVTAQAPRGAITAICGPNGAGKSTLLASLAGLMKPCSGVVTLDEVPLTNIPAQDRAKRIGYLPQSGEVAWNLSVRNLVALGRLPHGGGGEEQIEDALQSVQLSGMADRSISTLSGGERARALLARVLAGDPDWVLADEPLAALDFYHQHQVLACLRSAARMGRGVALVLHDLALAMNHADRVIVLDEGAVAADGPPEQALSADIISRVWGIAPRWLGEPGARALVI